MLSLKSEKDVEMRGAEPSFDKIDEREFDTPSNNNGIRRLIPVNKILIYDLGNDKVEAMVPTMLQAKNILRIDNWFYNQQFEPQFTISLTLGQLGLADGYNQEVQMAKFWKIFVDHENDKGQKELKNLHDSDNHTKPNCSLIMRKKTPEELNRVKIEPPQDEEMKNQISSRSSTSNRSESSAESSNSSSQSSRKSYANLAKKKKNGKQMIVKRTSPPKQLQPIVKSTKLGRVKIFKQDTTDQSSQSRQNRDSSEEWMRNLSKLNSPKKVNIILRKVGNVGVATNNIGSSTVQKLPKAGSSLEVRESMGEVRISKCGQFKKYKNVKNVAYIACEKAAQIFNDDKEQLHPDLQSMRKIVKQLDEISNYPSMKYKIVATPKYVTFKCQSCKTFQYWYQNEKEMTTQEFTKLTSKNPEELLSALEGKTINMKLYRRINQNHDLAKHSDVQFQ